MASLRRGVHGRLRVCACVMALLAGACAAPDEPAPRARAVPAAVLEMLKPDSVRVAGLGDGVAYRYLWSPEGPWAVHVIEADLGGRCDLGLQVVRSEAREAGGRGLETVSSMTHRLGTPPLAVVNADFFTAEGTTVGTEVVDGTVTAVHPRPALSWRPGSSPWMGMPTIEDSVVRVGWSVSRSDGDGHTEVVGGYPTLLHEGARVGDLGVSELPGFSARRHPRTAVGFDPVSGSLWIVVVDGRQAPYSMGMTLPELADLFARLGATEAINLDGGGSSVMVLGTQAVSRPSDAGGERAVANGVALTRDPAQCRVSYPR